MFNGCLYFNDRGVSAHLYEDCEEYYDNCGNYHKRCTPNIVDYDTILYDDTNKPSNRCNKNIKSECHESRPCSN